MSKLKSKKFPKSSLGQDWNEEKSERELGVYCSLKKGLPLLNSMLSKSQSMLRQETATVCQKRVKCSVCLWKCRLGDKCPHSAWGIWTCTFRRNRSFNCSSSLPLVSLIVVAVRNWHHFQTSEEAVIRRHVMPLFEKKSLPTNLDSAEVFYEYREISDQQEIQVQFEGESQAKEKYNRILLNRTALFLS